MNPHNRPIFCLGPTPAWQRAMIFDTLTLDQVNRAAFVVEAASGKSINAARVLRTLGCAVRVGGFLGGPAGRCIAEQLTELAIDNRCLNVAAATRTCVSVIDRAASTATELVEESSPLDDSDYTRLYDELPQSLRGCGIALLTGSLPPGAPVDFYARCTAIAHEQGIACVIDAHGQPLRQCLPLKPFLVKPNQSELAETVGRSLSDQQSVAEAMKQLAAAGPKWVLTTLGAEGALLTDGASTWHAAAPRVPLVSAIGSGDSLAAGLCAALAAGQSPPQALAQAIACGAANAMRAGAGFLSGQDVRVLLPQIRIGLLD